MNQNKKKTVPRKVEDLVLLKDELKQLENPPTTLWEIKISSSRLSYQFYDTPCEVLARTLLGNMSNFFNH